MQMVRCAIVVFAHLGECCAYYFGYLESGLNWWCYIKSTIIFDEDEDEYF